MAVDEYAWSSDKSKLLVFTNTRKVWRTNARGDYWVLTLDAGTPGALKKLGGDAPEASVMYAKFSPDGTRVAYVRAQNLYVEDLASGRILPLTTDGGGDIVNGTGDWVNEEEFSIYDGFKWSPDGRRIAFWQFDTSGVERFTLINNTAELYPTRDPVPVSQAGNEELGGARRHRGVGRRSSGLGEVRRTAAGPLHPSHGVGRRADARPAEHESPPEPQRRPARGRHER